jgi:hypothetical protein
MISKDEGSVLGSRLAVTAVLLLLAAVTLACTRYGIAKSDKAPPKRNPLITARGPIQVSSANTDSAEPAVAKGSDGIVYIAWIEHHENKEADLMAASFDSAGRRTSPAVRINPEVGQATAWRGDPPTIAVSRDGMVYVGWTAHTGSTEGMTATDLYLSASRDKGKTFAPPVKVNDDRKNAVHGMHSLTIGPDGAIYLAWLDERNIQQTLPSGMAEGHHMESNRDVFFAYSKDGGRTFSPNRKLATDACPCCKTALAVTPNGRVYASWRQVLPGDFRHIAVAYSTDGGNSFSQGLIVSDDHWILRGCPVSGPSLLVGQDGNLRVVWYSAGDPDKPGLYWSKSVDGGQTFSPRRLVAAGVVHGSPQLVLVGEKETAIWESDEGGTTKTLSARIEMAGESAVTTLISNSEMPVGVPDANQLSVAYITKLNNTRTGLFINTFQRD